MISHEQRSALLTALRNNIDWDALTTRQVEVGIRDARLVGREVTSFIQNGFRMRWSDNYLRIVEDLSIEIPALPRPTPEELQAKYRSFKRIIADTSTTDPVTMRLGSILLIDDKEIDGEEYERRRLGLPMLGFQHREWLLQHQTEFPEFMALQGKIYIDFPGLIVFNAGRNRMLPYLNQIGKYWVDRWNISGHRVLQDGRIAVSGR